MVKDIDGDPQDRTYNYVSVIGMIQYLQGHSMPGITFAVSSCAHLVHKTRMLHEIELERIGQYLEATMNKFL